MSNQRSTSTSDPTTLDPCRDEGRYKKQAVKDVQQLRSMHHAAEQTLEWPARRSGASTGSSRC